MANEGSMHSRSPGIPPEKLFGAQLRKLILPIKYLVLSAFFAQAAIKKKKKSQIKIKLHANSESQMRTRESISSSKEHHHQISVIESSDIVQYLVFDLLPELLQDRIFLGFHVCGCGSINLI